MTARTAKEFVAGLDDDRVVYLGNKKIKVTQDPTVAGSLAGVAGYYDWQNTYADDCLVTDEKTGKPMNASLIVPRNKADLDKRHRAYERLARYSYGMLGRTPDYCNTSLAGQVARADIWEKGEARFYDNLVNFHREVIEGDLSLTHTIIHAAIDRSTHELAGMNADLTLQVVKRDSNGITVRGGKVLATLGPFADELFVYPAAPIAKGMEQYALCFSIPVKTKGLIQICRDHYETPGPLSDRPFSTRFDEQDSFTIFDDVEIPWERVFVDGNLDVYNAIAPAVFPSNVLQQTAIRAMVKLEFAYDLCVNMARAQNNETRPDVSQWLGEIYGFMAMTRNAIAGAEARASDWGAGAFFPHQDLAVIRTFMPTWMVRVGEIIEMLGSHNLLCTPAIELFDDPEIAPLLNRYMPGANGVTAQERSQVFRTAWDFKGSALGSRVQLYERFYLGSRQRNLATDHFAGQGDRAWQTYTGFLTESGILPKD